MLLLSALQVLVAVSFVVQQQYIQWSMKEALEKEKLSTITIASEDLKWHKKGKEILHYHHLFDVKSIEEIKPGVLQITGLYDYEEQELHRQVGDNIEKNKTGAKAQQVLQQLLSIVAVEPPRNTCTAYNSFIKTIFDSSYRISFPEVATAIVTPPPQL
jgi:hypothetical protein